MSDTHALVCEEFTMAPGDVLYMPKGVVHYAMTENATEAFHLTIGLHLELVSPIWLPSLWVLVSWMVKALCVL